MLPQVALSKAPRTLRAGNVSAESLSLPGPLLLEIRRFADARGVFAETYSRRDFAALGVGDDFVQDNWSRSEQAGTVRGLHFQRPPHAQAKLVRVLRGRILDVAVDLRRSSPHLGRHVAVELAAGDGRMLYVPEGFAHGFCTLEPQTEVAYKVTRRLRARTADGGIAWDDPDLGIDWPVSRRDAVLSDKDAPPSTLRRAAARLLLSSAPPCAFSSRAAPASSARPWRATWSLERGCAVLVVDKLTYAGDRRNLRDCEGRAGFSFLQADITDPAAMRGAFEAFSPDAVAHLAAESHVDRSITGAAPFIHTNVTGTFVLLEAARAHWAALDAGAARALPLPPRLDRRGVRLARRRRARSTRRRPTTRARPTRPPRRRPTTWRGPGTTPTACRWW